jgi:acetate---CoA ligase (ADP-forming) subunit alpha
MINMIQESRLFKIANPKSIAYFGASNNFSSMGTNMLQSIQAMGFKGALYPVHPKEKTVLGLPAYGSVSDLPETPDLAVIVLPTRIVIETMDACGQKGIKHAIVVTAGFKEMGPEGIALEKKLLETTRKYGINIVGPNCIGVTNPHHLLNSTFLPFEGKPGFIGMASQSGSFITQMFGYLGPRGLGFSTGFSVGNEADIDIVDCMEYFGACPHTKVIALYVESIKRGRAFIETARAITPKKPIVAFYVGGSEGGRRAGFSHTGSLAGPDKLYEGVFRQSGVIRAYSIEQMFDFCYVLGTLPPPAGNRVVIQTHSGGPGAAAADGCSRAGLELPSLSEKTLEKLSPFIPSTASNANPVDLTYTKNPLDFFSKIPEILLDDANTDGMLVYFLASASMIKRALEGMGMSAKDVEENTEKIIDQQCDSMSELMKSGGKPLIGFSFLTRENSFIGKLQDNGVPVLPGPERAAKAMGALTKYKQLVDKISAG